MPSFGEAAMRLAKRLADDWASVRGKVCVSASPASASHAAGTTAINAREYEDCWRIPAAHVRSDGLHRDRRLQTGLVRTSGYLQDPATRLRRASGRCQTG